MLILSSFGAGFAHEHADDTSDEENGANSDYGIRFAVEIGSQAHVSASRQNDYTKSKQCIEQYCVLQDTYLPSN
jgi:hypothetical protein